MKRFSERLYPDIGQFFGVSRSLYRGKSKYQRIEVVENPRVGRVLLLDGVVQTTEADEFAYHEMLTHVPLFAHGAAKRVLIIGGGDGGMLEEVLKHPVEKVVMVELDEKVVEVSRKYLPSICGRAFADPRTELHIADGARFVGETEESFDVMIVDAPDPVGPAEVLFARTFYRNCRARLRPGGVLVTQNGVAFLQPHEIRHTAKQLRALFPHWGFYAAAVPTYYGGFMTFGWASEDRDLAAVEKAKIAGRVARRGLRTRYYNPDIHAGAFALPTFIRTLFAVPASTARSKRPGERPGERPAPRPGKGSGQGTAKGAAARRTRRSR